jgi:NADP-dependent 3-hydroxy acid dehydrogenase YdfG
MRVVVIGASSGLGRCIATGLGNRGNHVALLARRRDRLVDAAKEAGINAVPVACDVTDGASCQRAMSEVADWRLCVMLTSFRCRPPQVCGFSDQAG